MCGICGIYQSRSKRLALAGKVESMLEKLRHRGLYSGVYLDQEGFLSMGMVRLPIIDLSPNMPLPFLNEEKTICMAFNGEIYNYQELKKKLRSPHVFQTDTDAEVLLHLYEENGLAWLNDVDGFFSFAIWDSKKQELFLGRDSVGVKPLFYAFENDNFFFSSEIGSLKSGLSGYSIDYTALYEYLCLQYVPQPRTIFKEIKALMPGTFLKMDEQGGQVIRYWEQQKIEHSFLLNDSKANCDLLDSAVHKSVSASLLSEKEIGVSISGGVDSSLLAVIASRRYGKKLHTYCVASKEEGFDDFEDADMVAAMINSTHHRIEVTEDNFFQSLLAAVSFLDQPFAEGSFVAYHLLCKEAKKDVTVLLSGEGVDELFGGYEIYKAAVLKKIFNAFPKQMNRFFCKLASHIPTSFEKVSFDFKLKRFLEGVNFSDDYAHLFWRRAFSETELRRMCSPYLFSRLENETIFDVAYQLWHDKPDLDFIGKHAYLDFKISLPSDLLYRGDKLSMAHTLEMRPSFLQRELIDIGFCLPASQKVGYMTDKRLFRQVAKRYVPQKIANRKKKGFNIPYASWLLSKQGRDFMERYLLKDSFKNNIFLKDEIGHMLDQYKKRQVDYSHSLWTLLVLALWNEKEGYII